MRDLLEQKLARFEALEAQLVDPAVLGDSTTFAVIVGEHGSIAKLARKYRRFKALNAEIADARAMSSSADANLRELADAEVPNLVGEREALWNELMKLTLGGADANA